MKELINTENGVALNPKAIEKFSGKLHELPHKKDVLINKHAGNAKYLPIAIVETKLDELFFGLWQVRDFKYQVVANEIIGSIELGVYHPVAKTWLWRSGAGSVMIQQSKGSQITDIGSKIKNTLVKDFPHLKAQCLKNAALSLGPAFGRNLNRDYWDDFEPISEQVELADHAADLIERCSNEKELNELLRDKPNWHTSTAVYNLIIKKRQAFKKSA